MSRTWSHRTASSTRDIRFALGADQGNGCRGKARYPSRKVAKGVLRVMRRRDGVTGPGTLGVYRCAVCTRYHLGNSLGNLRKKGT